VRRTRNGSTIEIVLSRPEVHNAYDTGMRDGLVAALLDAAGDPSRPHIVLRGDGPSFCSGGDLDEFGTRPDPATAHLVRLARSPADLLGQLAARTTAYLHGACRGSGIELPAFAGRVVAAPDTTIGLPEIGMGLIPGAGGTVSLPHRIGRHRTAELALTMKTIDAATAREWGLVDEVSETRRA
jgi:enoyl-CoA hydratase/carnithine racemase